MTTDSSATPRPVTAAHLTREQATLLLTLHAKAADNRSAHSLLGDRTAEQAMHRIDHDFTVNALSSGDAYTVVARARMLDEWTRQFLREHPHSTVLHLGCGLDTRVFRVNPGRTVEWWDLDYSEVVELRRQLYPQREGYRMLGCSVTEAGWLPQLPDDRPTLILAEGLFEYLAPEDVQRLVDSLVRHFSSGWLVFSTARRWGARLQQSRWFRNDPVSATGATMRFGMDDPRELERGNLRLRFSGRLSLLDSPYRQHMPPAYRLLCLALSCIPALRDAAYLARYEF